MRARSRGTVSAIARLGDHLAARFPLMRGDTEEVRRRLESEAAAARELAGRTLVFGRANAQCRPICVRCCRRAITEPKGQAVEILAGLLVPVMGLAERAGLAALVREHVTITARTAVNAAVKVGCGSRGDQVRGLNVDRSR